ncbi:hypothetical protein V6N11_021545 [Hibiscus sabdariffa]|uniref:Uncharacterized protein n=2 Tax=Hibiscus sabdariffa TaxID=183260 RepID=A0ABR2NHW5_9ROSI
MVANFDRSALLFRAIPPMYGRSDIGQEQWSPPHHQWLKLNTDGARNELNGYASCGGVGRDSAGLIMLGRRDFVKTVQINHTNRSENNVADKLAKNANVDSLELTLFDAPPPWLLSLLLEDVNH